jgi:hypothetical protein
MKTTQKIFAIVLVLLLGATIYGLIRTVELPKTAPPKGQGNYSAATQGSLVDQSALRTAQRLAQAADTPEEQALSKEAMRLVDHELDLAYQSALRDVEVHPPAMSLEAKEIQARLDKAQKLKQDDEALVAVLTKQVAKASGNAKEALQDKLDGAQLQLESDEDEVDDATQDLNSAGGNAKGRIEQLGQEHEAVSKEIDNFVSAYPAPLPDQFGLVHRFQQLSALRQRQQMLADARQGALAAVAVLAVKHDALDKRIEAAKQGSPDLAAHAKKAAPGTAVTLPKERSHEESTAALGRMKEIVSEQKDLAYFDKRAGYN